MPPSTPPRCGRSSKRGCAGDSGSEHRRRIRPWHHTPDDGRTGPMKDDGRVKGEGRLYSRPRSPFYWMEVWQDGRQIRKSTGKTNKEDALKVLKKERQAVKAGEKAPDEERLTLRDLFRLLEADYKKKRRRSTATMRCSFQHFITFFGEKAKAVRLGDRLDEYETHRTEEGASIGTLRIELSLLHRAYHLAVKKKRFSSRSVPDIELPPPDPSAIRKGFFRRATVEKLCAHLPDTIRRRRPVLVLLPVAGWRCPAVGVAGLRRARAGTDVAPRAEQDRL